MSGRILIIGGALGLASMLLHLGYDVERRVELPRGELSVLPAELEHRMDLKATLIRPVQCLTDHVLVLVDREPLPPHWRDRGWLPLLRPSRLTLRPRARWSP